MTKKNLNYLSFYNLIVFYLFSYFENLVTFHCWYYKKYFSIYVIKQTILYSSYTVTHFILEIYRGGNGKKQKNKMIKNQYQFVLFFYLLQFFAFNLKNVVNNIYLFMWGNFLFYFIKYVLVKNFVGTIVPIYTHLHGSIPPR